MSYTVELSDLAKKQLAKLPKEIRKRIISVIERSRIRPEAYFEKLVGEKSYKLRAGDYRIIADIYRKELFILVIKVGHRKKIYKK
ncbi:MAG: type II toxin-antitoxin system RelE/ParE family toxin [archaeon]